MDSALQNAMLFFFLGHLGEGGERATQKYLGAHSSLVPLLTTVMIASIRLAFLFTLT